jgi:hypothetical protein
VTIAGPWPLAGFGREATPYRIVVHVLYLLTPLVRRVDIEVIVPRLPERPLPALHCNGQFQRLQSLVQHGLLRLTDQQMDMFRQHNISRDNEVVSHTHPLQRTFESLPRRRRPQVRLSYSN